MKKILSLSLILLMNLQVSQAAANPSLAAGSSLAASGNQNRIGVVAAVKGQVDIKSPAKAAGIVAESGHAVFLGDTISTNEKGQLQILLLDETVFTIGPNSSIVIDKFVYDPSSEDGEVKVKVVQGVFRFVTGKISKKKPENMTVDLPVGTIGVRGTMIAGEVRGNESLVALLGPGPNQDNHTPGSFDLSNTVGGETKSTHVDTSGFGSEIKGPDSAPTPSFRVPDQMINQLTGEFSIKSEGSEDGEDSSQGGTGSSNSQNQSGPAPASGPAQPGQVNTQAMAANFMDSTGLGEGQGGSAQDFFSAFGHLSAAELEALCGGDCSDFSEFLILDGQFNFLLPPPENSSTFEDVRSVSSNAARYFSNTLDADGTNNTLSLFDANGGSLSFGFDIQADITFGSNQFFLGNNSKITNDGVPGAFGTFEFKLDNDPVAGTGNPFNYSNTATYPNSQEFAFGGEATADLDDVQNELSGGMACSGCKADVFLALRNNDADVIPGDITEIAVTLAVELRIHDSGGTLIAKSDLTQDVLVGRAQSLGSDVTTVSP